MKALKIIGIALLSVLLIVVLVGYLQPKEIQVSVSKVINAPICVVFDHVNDMKKRSAWSPWEKADPTMQVTWANQTQGEGASQSWTSQNMGTGSMTYTEVVENKKIVSELNFREQGMATGSFTFEEAEDGVKTTWSFHTDMGNNPFSRLMGSIMIKTGVEASFKQGLEELAEIATADEANPCMSSGNSVEKAPSISDHAEILKTSEFNGIEMAEINLPDFKFIGILDSSAVNEMGETMANNYGELVSFMQSNEIPFIGAPMAQYHLWEPPTKVVYTCMMPVSAEVEPSGRVANGNAQGTFVVRGIHKGAYEDSEPTWMGMDAYLEANNLKMAGYPFEEYITDPESTTDTTAWITYIYYPVRNAQ